MKGRQWLVVAVLLAVGLFWGLQLGVQVALAEEMMLAFNESLEEEWLYFAEEDLVVGASKYKQSVHEAPAAVTIITARDIEQYGWRDMADLLRSVRGFYVTDDRSYKYAGVRGFSPPGDYNSKILLLLNGHRVNDGFWFAMGIENTSYFDLDSIKKIEIIRGPGSALYGTSAVFAVINVITKQGEGVDGLEVSYEAGSFDRNKEILSFGKRFGNGLDFYFSASAEDMDGQRLYYEEFDDPATNNGYAEKDTDEEDAYRFYTGLSLGDFSLQGAGYKREKHYPTAAWDTIFNDPGNQTIDEGWFVDGKYEHRFNDTDQIMLRAYHNYYRYEGNYWYDSSDWGEPYGEKANYPDSETASYYGTELQLNWQPFENNLLIVGGEYNNYYKIDQWGRDETTGEYYFKDERDYEAWSFYIQDVQQLVDKLNLILGLRYDEYPSSFGGEWNPRVGLVYSPWEETSFKFLYGHALRAPNPYELYFDDTNTVEPTTKDNPDLEPEEIDTYELVWEQKFLERFASTLSIFYYKMDDLIALVTDPADDIDQYVNQDEIESRGLELGIKGELENGIRGHVDFSYSHTREKDTGDKLLNSPDYMGNLGLSFPLIKDKAYLAGELNYLSRRLTKDGSYTDDVYLTNLTLSTKNLWRRVEVSASVYNLFDQQYGDPAGTEHTQNEIPQDGRNFRLKLTYTF